MATKTPKELAEATADAALDSLRAQLTEETTLREKIREAQRNGWKGLLGPLEIELRATVVRSDAAMVAWRKAQEAVPHSDRSSE